MTLLAIRGIGPQSAERLAARFAKLGDVRDATEKELEGAASSRVRSVLRDPQMWEAAHDSARRVIDLAHQHDVRITTVIDDAFPLWLREIPDRPPVLYIKGTLPPGRRFVACIGTREPSRFGELATQRITSHLAQTGWSIVSGLAIGVDTLAHRAALDSHGHTVAVLANGLDSVYPKKNARLAEEILDSGGALVSEQPFGAPAIARNLVSRDRLQSGMSAGTIVMQTAVVGGSMHTVRFTVLQTRMLFAPLPTGQHATEPKSRGILALTQNDGPALSTLVDAQGAYRDVLHQAFHNQPVAIAIRSRDDYSELVSMLEERISTSGTNPPPQRSNSQLGLF